MVDEDDEVDNIAEGDLQRSQRPNPGTGTGTGTSTSTGAQPTGSNSVQSSASQQRLPSFIPTRVRRETLLQRTGIDSRMNTVLRAEFRVNPNYPDPPSISRVQYRANGDARRRCAVTFIGSTTGLHISAPAVPRYLLQPNDVALTMAVEQLNGSQREWHDELSEHARQYAEVIRDVHTDCKANTDACEWVWQHMTKAHDTDSAEPDSDSLWKRSELATEWSELLVDGTCVLGDSQHSYCLRLQCANPQVMHIVAAALSAYALLRGEAPEQAKKWDQLLKTPHSTTWQSGNASTDSNDSSDSDGEWQAAKATAKKQALLARRHTRLLPTRMTAFHQAEFDQELTSLFMQNTGRPLLALSITLTMRAWEHHYMSCLVDNFQSIGCDTDDLVNDPLFQRLVRSRPEFMAPLGGFHVNQQNGGATASLFLRNDSKDMLPCLNDHVKTALGLPQSELRVKCTVQEARGQGRVIAGRDKTIFLNETVPVVRPAPAQRRAPTAVVSPPAPGSWMAAVLHGVKRAATSSTINHQPRKRDKPTMAGVSEPPSSTGQSPGPTSRNPATSVPDIPDVPAGHNQHAAQQQQEQRLSRAARKREKRRQKKLLTENQPQQEPMAQRAPAALAAANRSGHTRSLDSEPPAWALSLLREVAVLREQLDDCRKRIAPVPAHSLGPVASTPGPLSAPGIPPEPGTGVTTPQSAYAISTLATAFQYLISQLIQSGLVASANPLVPLTVDMLHPFIDRALCTMGPAAVSPMATCSPQSIIHTGPLSSTSLSSAAANPALHNGSAGIHG
jgi:hypothetical protein